MATTFVMDQRSTITTLASTIASKIGTNTDNLVRSDIHTDIANLLVLTGRHTHTYTDTYYIAYGNTYAMGTTVYTKVSTVPMYPGTNIAGLVSKWSGNSYYLTVYGNMGLEVSGLLIRAKWNAYTVGAWIATSTAGTFSGTSNAGGITLTGSGATLGFTDGVGVVTYDVNTKTFSGAAQKTIIGGATYLEVSGGLVRYRISGIFNGSGAYISLT